MTTQEKNEVICKCPCHSKEGGEVMHFMAYCKYTYGEVMHFMACCKYTYEKYLNPDGSVDEAEYRKIENKYNEEK